MTATDDAPVLTIAGEPAKPPPPSLESLARATVESAIALLVPPGGPQIYTSPEGVIRHADHERVQGELQAALDVARLPVRIHVDPRAELLGDGTSRVVWTLHADPHRMAPK